MLLATNSLRYYCDLNQMLDLFKQFALGFYLLLLQSINVSVGNEHPTFGFSLIATPAMLSISLECESFHKNLISLDDQ